MLYVSDNAYMRQVTLNKSFKGSFVAMSTLVLKRMQDTYQKIEIGILVAYDVFCQTNSFDDCTAREDDMMSGHGTTCRLCGHWRGREKCLPVIRRHV